MRQELTAHLAAAGSSLPLVSCLQVQQLPPGVTCTPLESKPYCVTAFVNHDIQYIRVLDPERRHDVPEGMPMTPPTLMYLCAYGLLHCEPANNGEEFGDFYEYATTMCDDDRLSSMSRLSEDGIDAAVAHATSRCYVYGTIPVFRYECT